MKKIVFIVEKTDTGYSAYTEEDNIYVATAGSNMAELKQNMLEAYNLYLNETGHIPIALENLSIRFDLPQFFDYYKSEINAKGLARRIGMNDALLNHYVKGVKQPSEKQTQKILQGIHDLGKELIDFA